MVLSLGDASSADEGLSFTNPYAERSERPCYACAVGPHRILLVARTRSGPLDIRPGLLVVQSVLHYGSMLLCMCFMPDAWVPDWKRVLNFLYFISFLG